ncbi:NAD-dependent epimerase/dehydratase family protein [Candidatus Berkelbacteria bacterium]|nr:NAD-dependent epimerase/dehydratase family protein [Candidatus Berkelbacteria bacterium]
MARYLVTGAAGFVGANLVRLLVGKGTIFCTTHPKDNLWRLKQFKGTGLKFKVVKLDLSDFKAVKRVVAKAKPDYIFHLAAYGTYPSQRNFRQIFNANTLGTANLLEALNAFPYKAFVMTGSSSEYGYKAKPMKESDVLEPNSFYSATKGAATLIAQAYGVIEQKPTVILRLFSIYGPWEEPGRFIPTAVAKCLKGNVLTVTSGKVVRDFVYIEDTIAALLVAAKKAKQLRGHIFNIGSGKQMKITDAAKKISKIVGTDAKIAIGGYQSRPWDATTSWQAGTRKSATVLGWHPTTSFEQGIKKTAAWLKDHMDLYQ